MTHKIRTASATALSLAIALISGTAPAASVSTYAFSDAGQSSSWTHGPPPDPSGFYGTYSGKITPSYDTTVTVDQQYQTSATGPVSSTSGATGGGGSIYGNWTASASSNSSAAYGNLGVDATTSASTGGDGNSLRGAVAYAIATDTYTITGGSGLATFRPIFAVGGTLTNNQAELQLELDYQINNAAALLGYRLQSSSYSAPSIYYNGYQSSLPGVTVSGNNISGTTNISFNVSFTFGTAFDLTTALFAGAVPGGGGSGTVSGNAQLVGYQVLQNGHAVQGISIQSASGVVPVPAAAWLFAPAIALLAPFRRRAA